MSVLVSFSQDLQGLRVSTGSANGEFSYSDDTNFNGKFDHDLEGSAFSLQYVRATQSKLYVGLGYASYAVSGEPKKYTSEFPGYPELGTYDFVVKVHDFSATFMYGIIGYEFGFNEKLKFQPNLRLGSKSYNVDLTQYTVSRDDVVRSTVYKESGSIFMAEIVLPLMYRVNESVGLGVNLCVCGLGITVDSVSDNSKYELTAYNSFNLVLDVYF